MQIVKPKAKKRTKPAQPKASVQLTAKAHAVRRRILAEWELTDAQVILLDRALSYSDLADRYQAVLDAEGLTMVNEQSGAARPHPALAALKLARGNFLTAWRMLELRDEAARAKPGRPVPSYPGALR